MRKHSSVLMLFCRSTLHWVLALLLAMAAVETLLFRLAFNELAAGAAAEGVEMVGMEVVFSESRIAWAFGAAFLLMTALLSIVGCEYGGRQGYTLRRLSISERAVFAWQSIYNGLCFFILWAVQVLMAWGLCLWYASQVGPDIASNQAVFLAFYRSNFLHSLLPLDDALCWVRNLLLLVVMGHISALIPLRQRQGKMSLFSFIAAMSSYPMYAFASNTYKGKVFHIVIMAAVLLMALVQELVYRKGEPDEA